MLKQTLKKVSWALRSSDSWMDKLLILFRIARWEVYCLLDHHPVITTVWPRARFVCHRGDGSARLFFYFRSIEEDFQKICQHFEGRTICAVDVGAHIGSFSVPLASVAGPQSRILAVEPQPIAGERLANNARLNGVGDRIQILPCCLGASRGSTEFLINRRDTSRSRQASDDRAAAGEEVLVKATIRTLDEVCEDSGIKHLDLLKMDVEGHELSVLQGAVNLLRTKSIALICFEYMPEAHHVTAANDPRVFLKEIGYVVSSTPPFEFSGIRKTPCASQNLWATPSAA